MPREPPAFPKCYSQGAVNRKGRAKALQGGAALEDIAASVDTCLLCGSCEPACPEGIGIAAMNMEQRSKLNTLRTNYPSWYPEPSGMKTRIKDNALHNSIILIAGEYQGDNLKVRNAMPIMPVTPTIMIFERRSIGRKKS